MKWINDIATYIPQNEIEASDKALIVACIATYQERLLFRETAVAHMTASAIVLDESKQYILMNYHNIYQSWSWPGGHTDGDGDLETVARKEVAEETGIHQLQLVGKGIQSLEVLPVYGHIKQGKYISSHLHLNVSYIYIADKADHLHIKPDENSAVAWLPIDYLGEYCTEPRMLELYHKLIERGRKWS